MIRRRRRKRKRRRGRGGGIKLARLGLELTILFCNRESKSLKRH